jgi:hypothetical protein
MKTADADLKRKAGDGYKTATGTPLELRRMDAYWRASNYLSVGQPDGPSPPFPCRVALKRHACFSAYAISSLTAQATPGAGCGP